MSPSWLAAGLARPRASRCTHCLPTVRPHVGDSQLPNTDGAWVLRRVTTPPLRDERGVMGINPGGETLPVALSIPHVPSGHSRIIRPRCVLGTGPGVSVDGIPDSQTRPTYSVPRPIGMRGRNLSHWLRMRTCQPASCCALTFGWMALEASLIGSDNQSCTPDISTVSGCTDFDSGSYQPTPRSSATGCVTFQMPTGVTPAKLQYTPGSGFGQ